MSDILSYCIAGVLAFCGVGGVFKYQEYSRGSFCVSQGYHTMIQHRKDFYCAKTENGMNYILKVTPNGPVQPGEQP